MLEASTLLIWSLLPVLLAHLLKPGQQARLRGRASKCEEDLERGLAGLVVELEAERVDARHVARFFNGEDGAEVGPADVHVEVFGLHVEEFAPGAETAEFA